MNVCFNPIAAATYLRRLLFFFRMRSQALRHLTFLQPSSYLFTKKIHICSLFLLTEQLFTCIIGTVVQERVFLMVSLPTIVILE